MLDLNSWHTVTATLSSATSELTVDDEPLIRGSTQSIFIVLNTHSLVWLGGYASFIDPSSATGTEEGFTGCISSLTINDQSVDLIPDADHGYGVSQCNTSSCEARPCMNGGSCVEEGPSFVCVCPPGLSGPLCSRDSDRCSSEPGLCADGATCVRSEDGTTYSCICPIGRDGERCDEGTPHNILSTHTHTLFLSFLQKLTYRLQNSTPHLISSTTLTCLTHHWLQ